MPRRGENIYKRKDGRWEGRMPRLGGGYYYLYGKTYKEIKEKKKNFQEYARLHAKKPAETPDASGQFERWVGGGILCRVKLSTYESYYHCIKKYVIPYFSGTKENRINELSVGQFVKSVNENKALSGTYKKKIITIFKIALKEILETSHNSEQVLKAVKMPKTDLLPVEVFSVREQQLIESEVLKTNDNRALGVLLCFYTGIRLGELCALKWGNMDFESGTMTIINTVSRKKNFCGKGGKTILTAGSPKSYHSIREIPIPGFLLKLASHLKNENKNNYILSGSEKPLDPRTYQRFFKKILKCAGVKDRKFHAIRHTFATRALETGVDIKTLSEILGHSSALITLKVYAHSLMEQKIAAIGKLNNFYITHMNISPFAVANSVRQD